MAKEVAVNVRLEGFAPVQALVSEAVLVVETAEEAIAQFDAGTIDGAVMQRLRLAVSAQRRALGALRATDA